MKPDTSNNTDKNNVFQEIQAQLTAKGLTILSHDFDRPWGGFFVLDEAQATQFVEHYFPNDKASELVSDKKVSPKILVVAPNKRLSWQYHHRRSEVWRVIDGKVGIIRSPNNEQPPIQELNIGDKVILAQGERHRLVGLDCFGIVAEIWQHTDTQNPSDENDIVRVEDDFGR